MYWTLYGVAFMVLLILAVATSIPRNVVKKFAFYLFSVKYLVLSKDSPKKFVRGNAFKPKNSADGPHANATEPVRIRVVFVRHAESVWNAVVNRFGLGWPIRAVSALFHEVWYYLTAPFDSVIIDSPLSARGKTQSRELAEFVRRDGGKTVPHETKRSVVVTSNLRRAMETTLIGIGPRISTTREKVLIDSSLQEASRNVDALSFSTQPRTLAPTPINGVAKTVMHHATFNPALNTGQKKLSSNVHTRTDAFMEHLLAAVDGVSSKAVPALRGEEAATVEEVIVVGHSLWFKKFFGRFLPSSSNHISKQVKMQNCAVITFDLLWDRNKTGEIWIEEQSIKPLFKNFIGVKA